MTAEVRTFLRHYIEILEEEVGMSTDQSEMEKLAKQLYRVFGVSAFGTDLGLRIMEGLGLVAVT